MVGSVFYGNILISLSCRYCTQFESFKKYIFFFEKKNVSRVSQGPHSATPTAAVFSSFREVSRRRRQTELYVRPFVPQTAPSLLQ